ncbi:hypothetical protein BH11MYX3_BH11MYX3_04390 [soil metagenome]
MAPRRPDGAALLVAGHGIEGGTALDAAAVHTLGQVGEALLATGAQWQIRRLTATAGERYAADRGTLKRSIDELVQESARVAVLVVIGRIVDVGGAPALVTGAQPELYPEESTLPLAWLHERIVAARAEQVVVVMSAEGAGSALKWLGALRVPGTSHLIATDAPETGRPLIDALLSGLCGEALDQRTGTVTMASLGAHLAGAAPACAVQTCDAAETIAQPPPLAGLWDVRRSQLSLRGTRPRIPRAASADDDLTGSVLPGRFRIDTLVARGTFGTVYRARQLAVERDVALKVLHTDIDPSSEDGRLFVHEIRSVGRIDHINVVRIHQADITHDGRLFFAMELLDGRDLQQLIASGVVPRPRAIELVRQLLAGLGAAHDAGLVHADVKPANAIVIERDGTERVVLVDFGLSRLRSPDRPAESAGGTPAYMAPEQMMEGRVDARSDLFSAALVFIHLFTGWRRPNAFTLTPPFELIEDPELRQVLQRALSADPAQRYQTAAELAAALTGAAAPTPAPPTPVLPFRHLAPLTETDRGRLHGREADLAMLTEHVLFRRSVIYTAPSGVGKTSLLRAGLVPRLEALGVHPIYVRCRGGNAAAIAVAIHPEAATIAEAVTAWHQRTGGKLVLVLDQLESALGDASPDSDLVREIIGFERWPADADICVVLTIREDYLARLVARTQEIESGIPILRLPPLGPGGARDAIVAPLTEARLAIEPELLETLLADLQRAAAALGPEMGWGASPAVYPPHLQLACSVLYEALEPGSAIMTLANYRRLGGFDAIVGEHLERVLDTELADGRDVIARDLFVALVTTAHERAMRPETELVEMVGARHGAHEVRAVLEALRSRGLLVRVRAAGGDPGWELVHDSLVPRVLAWLDRRDLDRRRAIELVRYHLRRSRPDAPSLLGRSELRELAPYADAIAELDEEWKKRGDVGEGWTPSRLVDRSRQVLRRRLATGITLLVALASIASVGFYRSHVESMHSEHEELLRNRDLGRFVLSLEPFDWDPVTQQARRVSPSAVPQLGWTLHLPDPDDPTSPGERYADELVVRSDAHVIGTALVENVEARGGAAFLKVTRGACGPSIVPLRQLPGYTRRELAPAVFHLRVPTCQATLVDTVSIPAGPFLFGGVGEPPATLIADDPQLPPEQRIVLPAFRIHRTEVTNAAFAELAAMSALTDIQPPIYPEAEELGSPGAARRPVSGIDWIEARAYCRFVGMRLPTSQQFTRAVRGGERLPDGSPNPWPRRGFPWGIEPRTGTVKVIGVGPPGVADVGSYPEDRSVEGVFDLAGNVTEWGESMAHGSASVRVVRGGSALVTRPNELLVDVVNENPRPIRMRGFGLGMRCVLTP